MKKIEKEYQKYGEERDLDLMHFAWKYAVVFMSETYKKGFNVAKKNAIEKQALHKLNKGIEQQYISSEISEPAAKEILRKYKEKFERKIVI